MEERSVQIQSILYHNNPSDVEKAIKHLTNAIAIYEKETNGRVICTLCYGDASKKPVFSEENINRINSEYVELRKVKNIFFNDNTGTAKGHNRLAKNCSSDYIMIMNPDVLVSPRFFVEMLSPFSDKRVGLTEARQTPIEHPKEYSVKTLSTSWSTTACVIFPTTVFRQVNGFDEDSFFMYCDDVDFSWRIRMAGYRLMYRPCAVVYHAKRLSVSGAWKPTAAERYYSAEAALMMAYKWSQNERLNKLLGEFKRSRDDVFHKAAEEFIKRKKVGMLPKQLDKNHKVATFVEGEYAKHRFAM